MIGVAIALMSVLYLNDSATPQTVGTALVRWMGASFVVFGVHELGHYIVAKEHCRFDSVGYDITRETIAANLMLFGLLAGTLVAEVFTGVDFPPLIAFGVVLLVLAVLRGQLFVSPGGVVYQGSPGICDAETALMGPMMNTFLAGAIILLPWEGDFARLLVFLSAWIGFVNLIPFSRALDGWAVWSYGNTKIRVVHVLLLLVNVGLFGVVI